MMYSDFPNLIGLIGVVLCLIAYIALQLGKLDSDTVSFSLLNLLASTSIIYSVIYHWNVAAFTMESVWMLISFYGLIRALYLFTPKKRIAKNLISN